jgi:hypothetical protein
MFKCEYPAKETEIKDRKTVDAILHALDQKEDAVQWKPQPLHFTLPGRKRKRGVHRYQPRRRALTVAQSAFECMEEARHSAILKSAPNPSFAANSPEARLAALSALTAPVRKSLDALATHITNRYDLIFDAKKSPIGLLFEKDYSQKTAGLIVWYQPGDTAALKLETEYTSPLLPLKFEQDNTPKVDWKNIQRPVGCQELIRSYESS